eukprot:9494737-Pyramimonas_sp.AAC.1
MTLWADELHTWEQRLYSKLQCPSRNKLVPVVAKRSPGDMVDSKLPATPKRSRGRPCTSRGQLLPADLPA